MMVEPRQFIRSDIVASLVAHLSIVALLILASDVHPFLATPSEPIAIDLVTPAELERTPEPSPTPQLSLPDRSEVPQPTTPAAPQSTPPAPQPSPQPQASRSAPKEAVKERAKEQVKEPAKESPNKDVSVQPPPAAAPAAAAYMPPEPDITVKYGVMLGLPPGPSAPLSPQDRPGDGVDATASMAANVDSDLIVAFRRHLRTCSRLPAEITASDKVMIKLRAVMAPDGTLATVPILVEASASAKGPILMQGAISALQACQPYTMLPKDRYGEWKVIDLIFTPQNFAG